MNNNDTYAKITARLITAMEQGVTPWTKPWTALGMPRNAVSLRPYSGINVWMTAFSDFSSPGWVTFKQAQSLGLSVRKGERGTPILFMAKVEGKKDKDAKKSKENTKLFFLARYYTVFNLDQLKEMAGNEGTLANVRARVETPRPFHPVTEAEAIVAATGATIRHGGNRAAYDKVADRIMMPPAKSFTTSEGYYGTLFHELAHWTGHESRLSRDLSGRFGEYAYAAEELVAEMASCFLSHRLGWDAVSNSAAYLDSWLKAAKENPAFLVGSASAASAAAEYLYPSASATTAEDDSEEEAA